MFCKHCGAKIDDNDEYCKYCGGSQLDNSSSDTILPFEDVGHSYHTPDPYEDDNVDAELVEEEPRDIDPNAALDPFSDATSVDPFVESTDSDVERFMNPFDKEVREDLSDVDEDKDVVGAINNSYMKTNGKNRVVTPTPRKDTTTYGTTSTGARFMKKEHLSEHDMTLAILTLVMAFVFPIAGIILGRKFNAEVAHLSNPDPFYMKIAKWGLIISYVDVGIWALSIFAGLLIGLLC